jgi:3-deoxy-D-manno-octulosonate 8-phosphate phosphatase (KDO 8-P phosphatase)
MGAPVTSTAAARAARVRLMILDVDGVLTDGQLVYGSHGEILKAFNVRDGHGIKLLRAAGVDVAILTARKSEIVAVRARELGIERVVQGASDKLAGFEQLLAATSVSADNCGYIGDDWPDLPVLARAGFAATVADAAEEVKAIAHWIALQPGGRGAVRALAEFIVRAQGRFDELLAQHRAGVVRA